MFIETLEFTIPVDLCSLCTTLQKSTQSGLEFPASVNSYGTTQDASIQVALKANKLTFKVDGVSSNASIISKSECRTLKLSVFDVDRTLIPQENDTFSSNNVSNYHTSTSVTNSQKRTCEQSPTPVRAKIRRNSGGENKKNKSPIVDRVKDSYSNNRSKSMDNSLSNNVLVKIEPEDPDLIEIDPDPEPLKTEQPEQSSSCMYEQTSHSSYEQNVPHVQDYSEPGTSQQHRSPGQNVDDFLVFQDDSYENDDNEEYSNDDHCGPLEQYGTIRITEGFKETLDIKRSSISSNKRGQRFSGQAIESSEQSITHCVLDHHSGEFYGSSTTHDGTQDSPEHSIDSHSGTSDQHSRQRFRDPGFSQIPEFMDKYGGQELYSSMLYGQEAVARHGPFACDQCGKMFTNPSNRRYHLSAVHGIGRVQTYCCVCGNVYKYPRALYRHRKLCPVFQNSQTETK